jgi:hypothetical protein
MTADTERGGHRGEGCRRGAAIDGALADPDDQGAIVLTAYARTGTAGPHPDGNPHHPSVRQAPMPPADCQRLLNRILDAPASAAGGFVPATGVPLGLRQAPIPGEASCAWPEPEWP